MFSLIREISVPWLRFKRIGLVKVTFLIIKEPISQLEIDGRMALMQDPTEVLLPDLQLWKLHYVMVILKSFARGG